MKTGRQKLNLQGQLSFVLAEDGTEVDFDYLQMIQTDSMLMVLHGEEHWEACKPESATVNVPDDKGIFLYSRNKVC
jgi:calcineurin-like phosphoesterase family protein